MLCHRTDRTVKHIEVLLDETTQKYRVKDESDAVSYANFLQFDSIQQLLDQCKQHASKMGTVLATQISTSCNTFCHASEGDHVAVDFGAQPVQPDSHPESLFFSHRGWGRGGRGGGGRRETVGTRLQPVHLNN